MCENLTHDFLFLSFKSIRFISLYKNKTIVRFRENTKESISIYVESSGFQSSILSQLLVEHVQSQRCFIFSTLKLSSRARRCAMVGVRQGRLSPPVAIYSHSSLLATTTTNTSQLPPRFLVSRSCDHTSARNYLSFELCIRYKMYANIMQATHAPIAVSLKLLKVCSFAGANTDGGK